MVEAIIAPIGGHGSDNISELYASDLILNTKIEYDEGGKFPVGNDYRTLGIVLDPYNYGTTTVASASALSAMKTMVVTGNTGNFTTDELIYGQTSGAIGRVVSWDSVAKKISYVQTSGENYKAFSAGENILTSVSGTGATVSTLGNPDVAKNTGKIIYLENRLAIIRALDQIDSITFVILF